MKRILAEGQDPLSESSLGSQPGISGPSGTPQHSDPEGLDEDSARPRAKSLVGLAFGPLPKLLIAIVVAVAAALTMNLANGHCR